MLPAYQYGDEVRVIRNVRNDGTYPGKEIGDMLLKRGSVGVVYDVGTYLQDQLIYRVHFFEAGCIVGCREEELIRADEEWIPNQFEFRDAVLAKTTLSSGGTIVAEKGQQGEVVKVVREPGRLYYHVRFAGREFQLPETMLEICENPINTPQETNPYAKPARLKVTTMMAKHPILVDTPTANTLNYRLLRIASERYGASLNSLDDEALNAARSIAEKEVFMERAVLGSPEARHVVVAQSEVHHALGLIRDRFEDDEAYSQALAQADLCEEDLFIALERELRVEAILNLVSSSVADVEDQEVELFYYMHREKFSLPETRSVSHILITINPEFAENTPSKPSNASAPSVSGSTATRAVLANRPSNTPNAPPPSTAARSAQYNQAPSTRNWTPTYSKCTPAPSARPLNPRGLPPALVRTDPPRRGKTLKRGDGQTAPTTHPAPAQPSPAHLAKTLLGATPSTQAETVPWQKKPEQN